LGIKKAQLDAGLFYTKSLLGNTGGTSNPNPAQLSLDKSRIGRPNTGYQQAT
jgi:hypothetical protein